MRMTQFMCFGATLLLVVSLMQQTQAAATVTASNKPAIVAQVQPKPAGIQTPNPTTVKPQQQGQQQQDSKCLQPLDPGPCRMSLDRFYYNKDTNACETFKYGGCRGNDNRFGFRQTCEEACRIKK